MLLLLFPETPERTYGLKYITPRDDPYQETGLLFGEPLPGNIGTTPAWLNAFNSAAASDDKEKWNLFLAEAEKAGFSPKSIQRSRESLGLAK